MPDVDGWYRAVIMREKGCSSAPKIWHSHISHQILTFIDQLDYTVQKEFMEDEVYSAVDQWCLTYYL